MTLPQYLLAVADSRPIGLPFLRWRPAVNARWPWTQVLARVALQTAGFVAAGLLLSWLLYRQVVAWPMWWLGLFGACRAMVYDGLTALVWNQRVERLRADPQLPTGLPRSRFRPGRWLLWLLYFVLLNLATPLLIWSTVENVRGKLAWDQFKRQWEAKGETFDLARVLPPAVPEDQNFALTPLLRPLYEFDHSTNGLRWRDTNAFKHLETIRADRVPPGCTNEFPRLGNVEQGTFTDLAAVRGFYRGNTNYPSPATPGTAAADVLVALGKFDVELKELGDAAAARPLARFPIHYEAEPAFAILLPHLSHIKGLCTVLQLRAVARLEVGRSDEALADLRAGFLLSDSVRDEPFLISYLVRVATLNIGLQGVREGLTRHAWNDRELADLDRYLASLDLLAEYKRAMRAERCLGVAGLDYLRRRGFRRDANDFFLGDEGAGGCSPRFPVSMLSSGWLHQNMRIMSGMHQEYLLPAVDEQHHRVFRETIEDLDKALHQQPMTPYNVLARMLVPALLNTPTKCGRAQTTVDAAWVACALERHRLAHGRLPDSLEELVPQFTQALPVDVMDGKPLRYRRNADGSYLLYSIGWNATDDGGEVVLGKGSTPRLDSKQGDWVWELPARMPGRQSASTAAGPDGD